MIGMFSIAGLVAGQMIATQQEAEDFERVLALAPESMRQGMIDRRAAAFKASHEAAQEERRHRELVEAAKPVDGGLSPLHLAAAFIFGAAIS